MAMTSMFLSKVCIPEPSTLKVWSSWARPRQGLRGREGNGCVHLTCVRGLERDHLAPFLFLVVLGLCCRARTLFSCSARRLLVEAHERPLLSFCCAVGSAVMALGLSGCPAAYGISVPQPGIKPPSPALKGRFMTTGPPGRFPFTLLT